MTRHGANAQRCAAQDVRSSRRSGIKSAGARPGGKSAGARQAWGANGSTRKWPQPRPLRRPLRPPGTRGATLPRTGVAQAQDVRCPWTRCPRCSVRRRAACLPGGLQHRSRGRDRRPWPPPTPSAPGSSGSPHDSPARTATRAAPPPQGVRCAGTTSDGGDGPCRQLTSLSAPATDRCQARAASGAGPGATDRRDSRNRHGSVGNRCRDRSPTLLGFADGPENLRLRGGKSFRFGPERAGCIPTFNFA